MRIYGENNRVYIRLQPGVKFKEVTNMLRFTLFFIVSAAIHAQTTEYGTFDDPCNMLAGGWQNVPADVDCSTAATSLGVYWDGGPYGNPGVPNVRSGCIYSPTDDGSMWFNAGSGSTCGAPTTQCVCQRSTSGSAASPPPSTAGAVQYPHLRLAYGGLADFRGLNDTFFSMLSVPGLDVAMKTRDATFMIKHNHRVDGSFITEMAISALLNERTVVTVRIAAAYETGFYVSDADGNVITRQSKWSNWTSDGIYVEQLMLTTSIKAHGWEVNATRKPVYNHIDGPEWRFDFTMRPLTPEEYWSCYPHGIIGQSFDGTGIGLLGKMDDYDDNNVKTSAMADGVIEGQAADYIVKPSDFVKHKYSRFFKNKRATCEPRNASNLAAVKLPSPTWTAIAGSEE